MQFVKNSDNFFW